MTLIGWAQIALVLLAALATTAPLGGHLARVLSGERTFLHPLLRPVETGLLKLSGVEPERDQSWFGYAVALLAFNAAGWALLYLILRLQGALPLNPQQFPGLAPDLAFNVAISFVSNTNWQSYAGETTLSPLSQMVGLTVQNFLSASVGIAAAAALTRGFARAHAKGLGCFWVDLTRTTLYVLAPLALVFALVLLALGVPQTLETAVTVQTLAGGEQTLALGPIASQIAIKMLGTNGGGYFNVNAAHPFENPNAWTNFLQLWAIIALPLACFDAFGRMVGDRRQGWTLIAVAMGLLLVATGLCYAAEAAGAPALAALGLDPADGNLEGKDVRFGVATSALWAVLTTGASNGAVNAMHDAFTPLGGAVPLVMIYLGEILPGGVGSGLYGMVMTAGLAVFVAGLMVGRTPEYLGKRIEIREIKAIALSVLILPALMLGIPAVSVLVPAALEGVSAAGPHGLSQMLYAAASASGNNGSAFAGFNANSPWWNGGLGAAMLLGRFAYLMPVLALAGSVAAKPKLPASAGALPTHGPLFAALLAGIILILGGLQFFPALALGPILEQAQMLAGKSW